MYLAYVLAVAQRWNLVADHWQFAFDLAVMAIDSCLENLREELKSREHFVEGDALLDRDVFRVRMTYLIALMSIHGLQLRKRRATEDVPAHAPEAASFVKSFCKDHNRRMWFWGEHASPQFLAFYCFQRTFDATPAPDFMLFALINAVAKKNRPLSKDAFANPYYDVEAIPTFLPPDEVEKIDDHFAGSSFTIEGMLHLFVRGNWKQHVTLVWSPITRLDFRSIHPDEEWQWYLWRCRKGAEKARQPKLPQTWNDLKSAANESDGLEVPALLKDHPLLYLCILCVYPHRWTSSGVRWLCDKVEG